MVNQTVYMIVNKYMEFTYLARLEPPPFITCIFSICRLQVYFFGWAEGREQITQTHQGIIFNCHFQNKTQNLLQSASSLILFVVLFFSPFSLCSCFFHCSALWSLLKALYKYLYYYYYYYYDYFHLLTKKNRLLECKIEGGGGTWWLCNFYI